MQPGNNYRIAASFIDDSMIADVQTDNPAAPGYLGPELAQDGGVPASPPLTVWRRLWVENDSMKAIPTGPFGYKRNDLSWDTVLPRVFNSFLNTAGGTTFIISSISDTTNFETLEHGSIIVQSQTLPVTDAVILGTGAFAIDVAGNHTNVPANSGFRLYDDDDHGLADLPLPRLDLVNEQMKNYFRPAFVEVIDAVDFNPQNHREVTFHVNEDVSENNPATVVDDLKDVQDRDACWACQITAAYQGPKGEDQDPAGDIEGFLMGETALHGSYQNSDSFDHSTVFIETCRENYDSSLRSTNPQSVANALKFLPKLIVAVATHELGHQPGDPDLDNHLEHGLMGDQLEGISLTAPENAKFSAKTIKRFRNTRRWSE